MLFNSFEFICIFFPLVTGLYFVLPHRWRWLLLLVASCWFYMAFVPVYILILAFTICVDYSSGLWIERSEGRKRKLLLAASIVANVGVLAFFKYFNFVNENIAEMVRGLGFHYGVPDLGILLPIGLSFHTFQSLSYTVEVYRRHHPAERNPGIFALYVMFYPQLVAGPIERPQALLPQFHARKRFNADDLQYGLTRMAFGFFKKVVVADRLAPYVDAVYADIPGSNGITVLVATIFFAVQIYCDFSGYSDIAIGAARVMGFRLMENFRRPYLSTSVSEFWGRWHISLSSWFRDYLYIPLGGNRVVKWRWYYNLMVVFAVSGLWHGAAWTYVIWGALHGTYLIAAILLKPVTHRVGNALPGPVNKALGVATTFTLVTLAWVFFRAHSAQEAFLGLRKMVALEGGLQVGGGPGATDTFQLAGCLAVIALLLLTWRLPADLRVRHPRAFVVITVLLIFLLGRNGGDFIYFQF
jgi:D-alanyl-lipoteichoic acid acyltransferase DltB (MBOAT superfamily)